MPEEPRGERSRRSVYSWLLYGLVLAFVGWFIWSNTGEIAEHEFELNWHFLLAAFLLLSASYLLMVVIWARMAKSFGLDAPFVKTARAWLYGQLGKYVPGKITVLLVRFEVYQGYAKRKVALGTLVEYVAMLASSSIMVLIAIAATPEVVPDYVPWAAGAGAILFLVLLWPPLCVRAANWALKVARREERIDEFPTYGGLLTFVGAYLFTGLLQGLAFYAILSSLSPVPLKYFLIVTGMYEAAGVIGIAAVFAPSGIGVREGVLFVVLPQIVAQGPAIIGVLIMRLTTTAVEFLLAGAFALAGRRARRSASG